MRKAFTLIELLVVIAIIAILAAILFPVFAQAKLAAKKSAGLAQMKQIGLASMMYANDNDDGIATWNRCLGGYPARPISEICPGETVGTALSKPEYFWDAAIAPYIKNGRPELRQWNGIWKSPGAEYDPTRGRSIGMSQPLFWDATVSSSGAPDTSPYTGVYYWLNLGQVEKVAQTMYAADTGTGGRYEPIYFLNGYQEAFLTRPAIPAWSTPWRYGQDAANYVWVDGHASTSKGNKIYPNPGPNKPFSQWSSVNFGNVYCAAAQYQGTTTAMRDFFAGFATSRGVDCSNR